MVDRMTSRQRVMAAINHQPPDRVPIDLNITLYAYQRLKEYLGLKIKEEYSPSYSMEVIPDPSILDEIGVDLLSIKLPTVTSKVILPEIKTDTWGVTRKLVQQAKGSYYEPINHPLAKANMEDLLQYPWPKSVPEKSDELARYAKAMYTQTNLALMGRFGGPILEIAADLLGMEEWFIRLAVDQEFIESLLDKISAICTIQDLIGLESAGSYLQIIKVSGEDLGMQTGPLYSLKTFRRLLLPPLKRRWQAIRDYLIKVNPAAKIMLHSCGAIASFIPDLINAGIEILDPVQPLAKGMEPSRLRSDFGQQLVFHGGIDIQQLLPFGTPEEVASGTRQVLERFQANQGGYILTPSHTVQADVPPENIISMINATKAWTPGLL